jgi:peptidoglycan/LPS O-acetylase OafA/YrhL
MPRGHIPALDAIRGLAIVAVTVYRFGGGGEGPAGAVEHSRLIGLGTHGVDLFFVLSGFLITGILFDAKGKQHYFRNFYMRRALRIFPLYYAALAVSLWLLPQFSLTFAGEVQPAADAQSWLWLYGANVVQSVRGAWCLGPLNHFWSLAIEEHFYLAWPAVICFSSRRTAMRICTGLFVISVIARAMWLCCGGNDVAAEVLTPLRMDGLVLGAWLALATRGAGGLAWLERWAKPSLLVFGSLALAFEFTGRRLFGLPYTCWAVACGALIVRLVASSEASRLAVIGNSRVLQFFGKYSYAMYVFQLPLIFLLAPIVTAPGLSAALGNPLLGQLIYCMAMFAVTTGAAWASWQLFEKRCLTLKHRFE